MLQNIQRDIARYPLQVGEEVEYNPFDEDDFDDWPIRFKFETCNLIEINGEVAVLRNKDGHVQKCPLSKTRPLHPFPPLPEKWGYYNSTLRHYIHSDEYICCELKEGFIEIAADHLDYWTFKYQQDAALSEKIEEEGRRMYGEPLNEQDKYPFIDGEEVWALKDGKYHGMMFKEFNSDGEPVLYNGDRVETWNGWSIYPVYPMYYFRRRISNPTAPQQPTDREIIITKMADYTYGLSSSEIKEGDRIYCWYGNSGNKFWHELLNTFPTVKKVVKGNGIPDKLFIDDRSGAFYANDFQAILFSDNPQLNELPRLSLPPVEQMFTREQVAEVIKNYLLVKPVEHFGLDETDMAEHIIASINSLTKTNQP